MTVTLASRRDITLDFTHTCARCTTEIPLRFQRRAVAEVFDRTIRDRRPELGGQTWIGWQNDASTSTPRGHFFNLPLRQGELEIDPSAWYRVTEHQAR